MTKYNVELTVGSFCYEEIEARSEKDAVEIAMNTMFDDIHHCPTAIVTKTVVTKCKK